MAQVTVIEWDQSGHYLLIGDTAGNAEIWTTISHLLNEWTRVANISLPDEPIQAGTFFFNGKKVYITILSNFSQIKQCVFFFFKRQSSIAKIEKAYLTWTSILRWI